MNPHQKNKVDIKSLSPDEQRLFRLYGKVPTKTDHLSKHLKERKYFDSGDYVLSKSGAAASVDTGSVGTQHPLPENIPHLSSPPAVPAASQGTGGIGGAGNGMGGMSGMGNHPMMAHGVGGVNSGSPVKESSYLNRQSSIDDVEKEEKGEGKKGAENASVVT